MFCQQTDEDFTLFVEDADPKSETVMHKKVKGLVKTVQQLNQKANDAKTEEQRSRHCFLPHYYSPNLLQNDFSFSSTWKLVRSENENNSIITASSSSPVPKTLVSPPLEDELVFEITNQNQSGIQIQTSNCFEFTINNAYLWANNTENKKSKKKAAFAPSSISGVPPLLLSAKILSPILTSTTISNEKDDDENNNSSNNNRRLEEKNISLGIFNANTNNNNNNGEFTSSRLSALSLLIPRNSTVYFNLVPLIMTTNSNDSKVSSTLLNLRLAGKFQSRLDWSKHSTMLYGNPSLVPIHHRVKKNKLANPKDGLFPPHRFYNDADGNGNNETSNNNNKERLVAYSHHPQLNVISMQEQQLRCLSACFFHQGKSGDREAIVDTFGNSASSSIHVKHPPKKLVEIFHSIHPPPKDDDVEDEEEGENSSEKKNKKKKKKTYQDEANEINEDLDYFLSVKKIEARRWSPLLILHHPKFKQFKIRYTPASSSRPVFIRRFPHRNSDIIGEVKFGTSLEATRVVYDEQNRDWYVEWSYLGGFSRLWGTMGAFLIALWPNMETTVLDPPRFFSPASSDEEICVRVRTAPDIDYGKKTGANLQHNEVRAAIAFHRSVKKNKNDSGSVYVEWADGSGFSRKSGRILKQNLMMMDDAEEDKNRNNNSTKDNKNDKEDNNKSEEEEEQIPLFSADEVPPSDVGGDDEDANLMVTEDLQRQEEQQQQHLIDRIARDLRRQRRVGLARRNAANRRNPDFTPFHHHNHNNTSRHHRHGGGATNNSNNTGDNSRHDDLIARAILGSAPGAHQSEYERALDQQQQDLDDERDPDETRQTFPTLTNTNNGMSTNNGGFPPTIVTPHRLGRRRQRGNDNNGNGDANNDNSENESENDASFEINFSDEDENNDSDDDDLESVLDEENYEERTFLLELPQIRSALIKSNIFSTA